MRSFLSLMLILVSSIILKAQHEADNWIFGLYDNMMVFTDTGAILVNAPPNISGAVEFFFCGGGGNATLSDKDGNLLFYTDGETLWNGEYDTISNPQIPLAGTTKGTNLFIPRPGHEDRRFVLTTSYPNMLWGLLIAEIDMNLNNGLGGLVPIYNYQLSGDMVPKLAATYHANGKDIWVVGHDRYSNAFKSFLITEEGVYFASGLQTNVVPVISNVGLSQQETSPLPDPFNRNAWGRMKISPGGNYIAMSSNGLNAVELFKFDISTGIVSNPVQMTIERPFDVEFSPDGTLLYVGRHYNCYYSGCNITYPGVTHVHQFNLLAGDSAAIVNSNTPVSVYNPSYWTNWGNLLQLGPDQKIYCTTNCQYGDEFDINVIHNPNQVGSGCNWDLYGVEDWAGYFGGGPVAGFPDFFVPYLDKNILFENKCYGDTTLIYTLTNTAMDSIRWEFTDPQIGLVSVLDQDSVYHIFTQPGSYEISLKRYRNGNLDELKKMIYIKPSVEINLPVDSVLCEGQEIILPFNYPYVDFAWINNNGSDTVFGDTVIIQGTGNWWPVITNFDEYCGHIDTIYISLHPDSLDLGDNVSGICISNPVLLNASIDSASYVWSTNDTTASILATESGVYWVAAQQGNCTFYDTVLINYDDPLTVSLPDTVYLCDSIPEMILAGDFPADFLWSPTGDTTADIVITQQGIYSVTASNACGDFTDSTLAMYLQSPVFDLGNDTVICIGDNILLNVSDYPLTDYLWSNGATDTFIIVYDQGFYSLSVSNACGNASDTIYLETHENNFLFSDDSIGLIVGELAIIDAGLGFTSYLWSTGETGQAITTGIYGFYWITVTDSIGCSGSDSILLYIIDAIPETSVFTIIKVYPNPVKDELIISWFSKNVPGEMVYSLYNYMGQRLGPGKAACIAGSNGSAGFYRIDFSGYPKGIYLLGIQQGNERKVFKVVKE
ncbi:MAG: T9SS type A sorting domain-containing protein [Bacteroidales bacterium]|nr:T9SS type A sorting domain-containing protein [Bacteroidales bacterium]MCF8455179.1 T9SS type A sorting domain-containing protein [Bacteroidales bacterium]